MNHPMLKLAIAGVLATLPAATALAEAIPEKTASGWQVTFRLDASEWDDKPTSVNVAGEFNGWNAGADALADLNSDNVWEVAMPMSPGRHGYKFVIDGNRWMVDPTDDSELREGDNYGGENSGVLVGPDIRKASPAEANAINGDFLSFDPQADVVAVDSGVVRLRVRAQAGDVEKVTAVIDGEGTELPREQTAGGYDSFVGTIEVEGSPLDFYLVAEDGSAKAILNAAGVFTGDAAAEAEKTGSDFSVVVPQFDVPKWAADAVWYQIFPERFRNGEPANDPGRFDYELLVGWNTNWWDVLEGETPPSGGVDNFYEGTGDVWDRRYGGDLQGVREKLPYLRELGVNAIYFNPIFEGESMHKYDTADFRHVDDNFGVLHHGGTGGAEYPPSFEGETADPETWVWSPSDLVFLDFIEEAHAQGFKVVIDGVFNHVGTAHPFFQDVLEKGKNSEFADWFEIVDWGNGGEPGQPGGIQWAAWDKPNGALPVFKKDVKLGLAEGPRQHIFDITRRWLDPDGDPSTRDGIDGWRLDVPGDIPHPFWVDWRKVVKEANPDAYITGEIWSWADAWLKGDQFDAVMNYQFAMDAMDFFIDQQTATTPSAFMSELVELTERYPRPITYAQQNLMASHDTDRLASMFVNPDRPYDGANRPQDNAKSFAGPMYSEREPNEIERAKMRQLVYFQHSFVGAPMTYYGDEAGMWAPDDPSNRQPFPWLDRGPYSGSSDGFDEDVFAEFQRAIAIRESVLALRRGDFQPVMADDETGVVAFAREHEDGLAYVVLNRSGETRSVSLDVEDGTYVDYVSDAEVVLNDDGRPRIEAGDEAADPASLELPAYGVAILVKQ